MVNELHPEYKPDLQGWRNQVENWMRGDNYFMLVAEDGGKLFSFMDWFIVYDPANSVTKGIGNYFYALPETRAGSLPGRLWRAGLGIGKKFGIGEINMTCDEKKLPFWKKHGFEPVVIQMKRGLNHE